MMELSSRLDPVLDVARTSARQVDTEAAFPENAVAALRVKTTRLLSEALSPSPAACVDAVGVS